MADAAFATLLTEIQAKVKAKRYRLSSHAEREREADQITVQEVEEALLSKRCEVIEDYPDDPRGHSCLVLGFTAKGLPIHLVCGMASDTLMIITLYRQDPAQWIEWKIRKENA